MDVTSQWIYWSLFSCFIFHTAWWSSKKARTPDPELDKQYPEFRGLGEEKWCYWTMLLQSFTIFPIKFALWLFAIISCGLIHVFLGKVDENTHLKRRISAGALWFSATLLLLVCGYTPSKRLADFDYSKWLGPNWRQDLDTFKKTKRVSTYIPNHTGLFDIYITINATLGMTAFVAGSHMRKTPCFNSSIEAGDGIFAERTGDKNEAIQKTTEISTRQLQIESGNSNRKPLVIYAEGLCTDGKRITKFKRGAFQSLSAVTPVIQKHSGGIHIGGYNYLDHVPQLIAMCTMQFGKTEFIEMPPFVPNEYLFAQRPDLPKWEAYAEAVREAMCEYSGLEKDDSVTFSRVKEYIKIMQGGKGWLPWARNFR